MYFNVLVQRGMFMKKMLGFLLAVGMMVSVVGCSEASNTQDSTNSEVQNVGESEEIDSAAKYASIEIGTYNSSALTHYLAFADNTEYILDHIYADAATDENIKKQTLEHLTKAKDALYSMSLLDSPETCNDIQSDISAATSKIISVFELWEKRLIENTELDEVQEEERADLLIEGSAVLSDALDELQARTEAARDTSRTQDLSKEKTKDNDASTE